MSEFITERPDVLSIRIVRDEAGELVPISAPADDMQASDLHRMFAMTLHAFSFLFSMASSGLFNAEQGELEEVCPDGRVADVGSHADGRVGLKTAEQLQGRKKPDPSGDTGRASRWRIPRAYISRGVAALFSPTRERIPGAPQQGLPEGAGDEPASSTTRTPSAFVNAPR